MLATAPAAGEFQAATARSSTPTEMTGNTPINTQHPAITHMGASIRQIRFVRMTGLRAPGSAGEHRSKSLTNVPTAIAPTSASAGAANPTQLHAAAGRPNGSEKPHIKEEFTDESIQRRQSRDGDSANQEQHKRPGHLFPKPAQQINLTRVARRAKCRRLP